MITIIYCSKQLRTTQCRKSIAIVERMRANILSSQFFSLSFATTIQRLGLSIRIHSNINQSLQNLYVQLFNVSQSFCKNCLSFFRKYQSLCRTNQSFCIPNQSPQKLNQCSQETIRKQWFLIRFCDFILELLKNNWKREGLNKQRKGNTLQAMGKNRNVEGLIKNAEALHCFTSKVVFLLSDLAFFTHNLNINFFINLNNLVYEKSENCS